MGHLSMLCVCSIFVEPKYVKFEDTAENVCAHKLLLSSMSPVFREQFYGPLSANAKYS